MEQEEIGERLLEEKAISGREEEEEEALKERVCKEYKKLWKVAGPAIFSRFSTFGVNVISLAFIGHIGATELAAYALVVTVLLRFANGILVCIFPPNISSNLIWTENYLIESR